MELRDSKRCGKEKGRLRKSSVQRIYLIDNRECTITAFNGIE